METLCSFGIYEEYSINRISGKNGTYRKYILGKRNKYCAKAVIAPDPNTKIVEVGILASFCNDVKVLKDGDYLLLYI